MDNDALVEQLTKKLMKNHVSSGVKGGRSTGGIKIKIKKGMQGGKSGKGGKGGNFNV